MKNVLFYTTAWKGAQECLQIEEAINQYKKGNRVYWIYCDHSLGVCYNNPRINKGMCKYCENYQKKLRKKFLPQDIVIIPISSLIDSEIEDEANIDFKYTSAKEMATLEYQGVEIGMGCLSSYISKTRNMNPLISTESKVYFDKLLHSEVLLTLAINKFLDNVKIDLIVFHNGRFAQFKPLLNIAQSRKINYICTESYQDAEGGLLKNFFNNTIPHDFKAVEEKIDREWNNYDPIERERLGKMFYERKRSNLSTGDKVYTSSQKFGLLPNGWDTNKENIVICNSSEDEYCAIGKDYDLMKLFESQLIGIKAIASHYKDDNSKRFYLRIHPNLKDIRYKYHTDLLELNFPNLTIIPGNSSISTYSLLDNADKVIAFGSTAGIEAVYRHKPLISLGPAEYNTLGVAYIPHCVEDLWEYIDNPNLPDLYNVNVIKLGFYYMALYEAKIFERCRNIDGSPFKYDFRGRHYFLLGYQKIWGSNLLYLLYDGIRRKMSSIFFKDTPVPEEEE